MTHLPSGSLTARPWKATFPTGAMLNFGGVLFWGGSCKHQFPTKLHQRVVLWYSTVHLCFELQHHRHPEKTSPFTDAVQEFFETEVCLEWSVELDFWGNWSPRNGHENLRISAGPWECKGTPPPPLCHLPQKLLTSMIPKCGLTLWGGTLKFPWIQKAPGWPTITW